MFLPLKDHNPTERFPVVTVGLIALNVLVFIYEMSLGDQLPAFIASFGAIPYELTHLTDLVGRYRESPVVHFQGPQVLHLTLITSMFMHGGIMHIVGNMLYLWIFGNNVEDLLGRVRFLVFYLATGLAASVTHIATNANSTIPTVGASGAVAGVLGAYLIAYPRARVTSLIFLGIFIRLVEVPAALVLAVWFILQFFQGVLALGIGASGGVAWWAHIGGFVMGILLVYLFGGRRLRALREAQRWSAARLPLE